MLKLLPWLLTISILQSGCGSVEPFYSEPSKDWQSTKPVSNEVRHTVYLVGDAGEPDLNHQEPVLKLLQHELEKVDSNSAVVFLGDNIYNRGMPVKEDKRARTIAEHKINESLDLLLSFRGRPIFVPGNHDWNNAKKGGLLAVKEQQAYIEEYVGRNDVFFPTNGCAGPVRIELGEDLAILILDSQWWLHDREKEHGINVGCEFMDEASFLTEMKNLLDVSQQKKQHIIIASHHPIFSNGSYGGYFSLNDHLFPLTNIKSWLYLPLPIVGSLYPLGRKAAVPVQDIPHRKYQAYCSAMLSITRDIDNVVFASGHEHNLQYFRKENKNFIVSGSGSKVSYVRKGTGAEFSYAQHGFTKLIYYTDDTVWIEVWTPEGDGSNGTLVYRSQAM